jgi:hypothetical protein
MKIDREKGRLDQLALSHLVPQRHVGPLRVLDIPIGRRRHARGSDR